MQVARRSHSSASAPADLERALHDLGIEVLKADDDECWALCPLHEFYTGRPDSNPSWSVNRVTGWHSDFSCPYSGSFISLVCDMLEIDPFSAARWVDDYGVNLERVESLPDWEERFEEREISRAAAISEEDLLQFVTPPKEALEARAFTSQAVEHYGVLWDSKHQAWILPIRTLEGELLGWQSKGEHRLRSGNDRVRNYPRHVRKRATLFGADVFTRGIPAVVFEGPLDAIRLKSAEVDGGVATWGDKFSDQQMLLLRDLTDEVVWASDNDDAGRAAARLFRDGDRKTRRPPFSRWFHSRFLNYAMLPVDANKDIGEREVADIHIQRSVRSAQHVLIADLGEVSGLHGGASPLPATGVRDDGGRREGAGGVRTRNGQDSARNRRRGSASGRIRF